MKLRLIYSLLEVPFKTEEWKYFIYIYDTKWHWFLYLSELKEIRNKFIYYMCMIDKNVIYHYHKFSAFRACWKTALNVKYSIDHTQPNTKANPNSWSWVCFGLGRGLLFKRLDLLWVCYGFTWSQLFVSALANEVWHFFSLYQCKPATCKFLIHMQKHLVVFQLWFKGLLLNLGFALSVCSWLALGLLGVSSGSTIPELKQTQKADLRFGWGQLPVSLGLVSTVCTYVSIATLLFF